MLMWHMESIETEVKTGQEEGCADLVSSGRKNILFCRQGRKKGL
jgi:hypothetical protein